MITVSMCATSVEGEPVSKERLAQIISDHKEWLEDHSKGSRACLIDMNLEGADLSGVDLSHADLSGAYLVKANMAGVKLTGAILDGAYLSDADLTGANLDRAKMVRGHFQHSCLKEASLRAAIIQYSFLWNSDFKGANLKLASLTGSELCDCTFETADLSYSDLYGTNMDYADFSDACLKYARLGYAKNAYYADFTGADLTDVDFSECALNEENFSGATGFHPNMKCPEEGSFIAWKRCRDDRIVKLLIPETAERTGAFVYICRASEAIVLDIRDRDGEPCDEAFSKADKDFLYRKGETVRPKEAFDNHMLDDGSGIHFFLTRTEAELYEYPDDEDERSDMDSAEDDEDSPAETGKESI